MCKSGNFHLKGCTTAKNKSHALLSMNGSSKNLLHKFIGHCEKHLISHFVLSIGRGELWFSHKRRWKEDKTEWEVACVSLYNPCVYITHSAWGCCRQVGKGCHTRMGFPRIDFAGGQYTTIIIMLVHWPLAKSILVNLWSQY